MTAGGFTRDPRALVLDGVRTADVCAFVRGCGRALVADLTLGSWRVHHAAADLAAQLGVPEPAYEDSDPRDELARRADAETAGDRATREALQLAGRLASALGEEPAVACVLLPRDGAVVERHDTLLVRFLAQALAPTGHRLVLLAGTSGADGVPGDWTIRWTAAPHPPVPSRDAELAALVPGVVRAQLDLRPGEGTLPLLGGCLLVAPEARRGGTPEAFDGLAEGAGGLPWLAAYALAHGSDERLDPWRLFAHAALEFRSGACEVPLALLRRAERGMRSPSHVAVVRLMAQGVRIFNQRFPETAALPPPAADLPGPLRGVLLASRGWGLTMTGRPEEAEACLAQARDALDGDPPSDELLSLLNISALNRLKLGDWDGALALEHRIRAALDERSSGAWQFRYVNALNLSRLYRRRGRHADAEAHRREAFATVAGVRSESDAIHANLLAARIAEDRGDADAARVAWTRTALHWAAAAAPEAVAPRVTGAIVRGDANAGSSVCDRTSETLLERLGASAQIAGGGERAAAFVGGGHVPASLVASHVWTALEVAGSLVLCGEAEASPALRSPSSARLAAALLALLGAPDGVRAVIVDDRLGQEIPGTRAELLESCLRLGVRELVQDGVMTRLDDLEQRLEPVLGAGVDAVEPGAAGLVVSFKRYRAPLLLTGERAAVVEALASRSGAAGLAALELLRGLERDRVVYLRLPPDGLPPDAEMTAIL